MSTVNIPKMSFFERGFIHRSTAVYRDLEYCDRVYMRGPSNLFWELILDTYTEAHTETFCQHDTLSESLVIHATGSAPLQIDMQGFLASGGDIDHRARFMRYYLQEFRGKALQEKKAPLRVRIRDTEFNLLVHNIVVTEASSLEEFTAVTISGVAGGYRVYDSENPFTTYGGAVFEYAGTTGTALAKKVVPVDGGDEAKPTEADPEVSVKDGNK